MRKANLFSAICVAVTLFTLSINPAYALVVYKYAGNNFETISDRDPPAGSYTTSQNVSLEFTVPSLLTDLGPVLTNIKPNNFTITDGRTTFTDASFLNVFYLKLTTDGLGNIIDWFIATEESPNHLQIGEQAGQIITDSISNTSGNTSGRDLGGLQECISGNSTQCFSTSGDSAQVIRNPGIWTVVELPKVADDVDIGSGTTVAEDTTLSSGSSVGDNSTIGADVTVSQDTQLGDNTEVGDGSDVGKDVVAGDNLIVGINVKIEKDVTIGARVTIGDNSTIRAGTVIGNDVQIGIIGGGVGTSVGRNVTILSNQVIADGEVIPNNTTVP